MVENRIKDIEICDPHNLTPHPKNRNKHSKEQIERLCQILKYQGWRYPIKVSRLSGYITSGHGRREAAMKMGLTKVPVSFQEYESEEQEYADVIADNAIASWSELDMSGINFDLPELGPDFDIDLLGIKDFVLEPAEKFHSDPDEVPEPPKEAITKPGDLWLLGDHRLLCGDSTKKEDVERLMNGEKADMVFTDPPYGINYSHAQTGRERIGGGKRPKYEIQNDKEEDLGRLLCGFLSAMLPILAENWSGYIFYSDNKTEKILESLRLNGIRLGQYLLWVKNNHTLSYFKYQYIHEPFLFVGPNSNVKPNGVWYGHHQTTVWQCPKDVDAVHPTQKPVALAEMAIGHVTEKGAIVYEPFLGSGSTLIACEKTNRKCRGVEIDPVYCDVVVARWEKFTGKKAIRG